MMAKICREAEADIDYSQLYPSIRRQVRLPISHSEAIASSAVKTSWDVHAALIIVLSQTGNTALKIAKYRPIAPVLAVTSSKIAGILNFLIIISKSMSSPSWYLPIIS